MESYVAYHAILERAPSEATRTLAIAQNHQRQRDSSIATHSPTPKKRDCTLDKPLGRLDWFPSMSVMLSATQKLSDE